MKHKTAGSDKAVMMLHWSNRFSNGKWLNGCELGCGRDKRPRFLEKGFWRHHRQVWLGRSLWVWLWAHSVGGVTDKTVLEVKRLAKLGWLSSKLSQNYSGNRPIDSKCLLWVCSPAFLPTGTGHLTFSALFCIKKYLHKKNPNDRK